MELWNHQKEAIDYLLEKKGSGLFLGMGTGKTFTAMELVKRRGAKKILVVCPKPAVRSVWGKQLDQFMRSGHHQIVLEGSSEDRAVRLYSSAKELRASPLPVFWITNYEGLLWEPLKSLIKRMKLECIIADEGHKLKAPGGSLSRLFAYLGNRVEWRIDLTGTPMPNNPLDIYGQYRFLDKTIFGTNYSKFQQRYCNINPYSYEKEFIHQDEMHQKIFQIAFQVESEDVLDLPETQDIEYKFDLNAATRRAYQELYRELITVLDDGTEIVVANVLSKILRLQQLTSGVAPGTDYSLDTGKQDTLGEVLSELSKEEPVVVFCRFRPDLGAIRSVCQALGRTCTELSGAMDGLSEFNSGRANTIAVQIQAGSTAIDLSRARYCIFLSPNWSLGDYQQARKRVHRPGQTRNVVYIHIVANNTIDEDIYAALSAKDDLVKSLLRKRGRENVRLV